MDLSTLAPKHGARQKRRVLGRGEASGLGKTSGKGGKGQTARTGGTIRRGFEGGQMPLVRRIPKLGFVSRQRNKGLNRYAIVNLDILERFDAGSVVDAESLKKIGFGTRSKAFAGIKVLGTGKLTKKLTVKVDAISESAKKAIEAAGGVVQLPEKRSNPDTEKKKKK